MGQAKTPPRRPNTWRDFLVRSLPLLKNPLPEDQAAVRRLLKFPRSAWRSSVLPSHLRRRFVPMFSGGPWDVVWTFTFSERLSPDRLTALAGLVTILKKQTMLALLEWAPTGWAFYVFLSLPHRRPQAKRFLAEVRGAARADGVVMTRRRYSAKRGMGYYLSHIRYFCTPFYYPGVSPHSRGLERARAWQSSSQSRGSARRKGKQPDKHD
jgi:hypothetical protein